jgi:hypothetical protein
MGAVIQIEVVLVLNEMEDIEALLLSAGSLSPLSPDIDSVDNSRA